MEINLENIYLDLQFTSKKQAIDFIGEKMLEANMIKQEYIESMHKRDKVSSVAIGNYLAIPHGEYETEDLIINKGIIVIKLKKDLEWDGEIVKYIIGLALNGDDQLETLQSIAIAFMDSKEVLNNYNNCNTKEELFKFLKDND